MRNRLRSFHLPFRASPKTKIRLTANGTGTQQLGVIVYGTVGSSYTIKDSLGTVISYTVGSTGNDLRNIDASVSGGLIDIIGTSITRFTVQTGTQLTSINILEEGALTSLQNMANGSSTLTSFSSVDLPNVTNMSGALRDTSIITFPNIDVSNVNTIGDMFYGCSLLEAINSNFSGVTVSAAGFTSNCNSLKCLGGLTTYASTDTTSSGVFNSPVMVTPTPYEQDRIVNDPNGYSYVKPSYLNNCTFGDFEANFVRYDTTHNMGFKLTTLTAPAEATVIDTNGVSTTYTSTNAYLTISGVDVSGTSDTVNVIVPNVRSFRIYNTIYVKEAHIINEGTLQDASNFNGNYNSKLDTFTSPTLHYLDDASYMFWHNSNLVNLTAFSMPFCTKADTMFAGVGLTSFDPNWDFSKVKDMSYFLDGANSLTSLPQLDLLECTSLNHAFQNMHSLTTFTGVTLSQISGDTVSLQNTWSNCDALTSFPTIDLSKVIALSATWSNCSALTSFPLLDTSTITSLDNTWQSCSGLVSFPSMNFNNVTTINHTWDGCSGLTSFPAINFPGLNSNALYAWKDCSGLTSFPLITLTFSGSSPSVSNSWKGCTGLTTFPAIDLSTVKVFTSAWNGCASMTTWSVPNISNANNADTIFDNCTVLNNIVVDLSNATTLSYAFRNCTALTSVNDGTGAGDSLNLSSATSLSSVFQNCTSLVSPPILDVSSATSAFSTFAGCTAITNIRGLGTGGSIGSMSSMFANCSSLVCLDAMNGTSSSASNNPANVFSGCTSLIAPNGTEQVDIVDNNVNWVNPNPCP